MACLGVDMVLDRSVYLPPLSKLYFDLVIGCLKILDMSILDNELGLP